MNTEEKQKIQEHLREVAKILQKNTPIEQQQDFESLELALREHLLETVAPPISDFFLTPERASREVVNPEK